MKDPATLRVCVLLNYRESGQMTMKLYAEHLGEALKRLYPKHLQFLWYGCSDFVEQIN